MLNKKELIYRIIIVAVCALLVFSACRGNDTKQVSENETGSSEVEEKKEGSIDTASAAVSGKKNETVQIKTDAEGIPDRVKVQVKLSDLQKGVAVRDFTCLTEIINTGGNEEYILKDQDLYFENLDSDISYEGIYHGELPVSVKITYYLDDIKIDPKELAGRSGKLRMHFDYDSTPVMSDGDESYKVLFTALTYVMLDEDVFSDIEVKNGSILEVGGEKIALGITFPGIKEATDAMPADNLKDIELPEYFEISADVRDFKLEYTSTIFTPGILSELKDEDIDSLFGTDEDQDGMKDKLKDADSAGKKIKSAGNVLQKGFDEAGTLLDKTVSLFSDAGMKLDSIKGNKDSISNCLNSLKTTLEDLRDKASGIKKDGDKAAELGEDINKSLEKISGLQKELDTFEQYIRNTEGYINDSKELIQLISSLKDEDIEKKIRQDLKTELDKTDLTPEEKERILSAVSIKGVLDDIRNKARSLSEKSGLIDNMDISYLKTIISELRTDISSLQNKYSIDMDGIIKTLETVDRTIDEIAGDGYTVEEFVDEIFTFFDKGTEELDNAGEKLKGFRTILGAFSQYRSGVDAYVSGMSDAIGELIDELDASMDDMEEMKKFIKGHRDAGKTFDNISGKDPSQECEVVFIFETGSIEN